MSIKVSQETVDRVCSRCGVPLKNRTFPAIYSALTKGSGRLPVCRSCIEEIYEAYFNECGSSRMATRQLCRKLDLYWDDRLFDSVERNAKAGQVIKQYLSKLGQPTYAGMSYDDTLIIEGKLWDFADTRTDITNMLGPDGEPIGDDVIAFWGPGYTPAMYYELEQRRSYWMSKLSDGVELDVGTEAIIRQICSLELDINRDRAAGRSVEKSIGALNTLLGSANLKPVQKRQEEADASLGNTPLGVWLYRYENKRPLPETYEDSKILKYVFTWMGHLCKMMGVKGNKYTKLYEDEIRKYTVNKPEYDGDDEEAFLDELDEMSEDPRILMNDAI